MLQQSSDLAALAERVWGSFLGRCVQRFLAMTGIDRCIVISSQAFTALMPLLILVSTVAFADQPNLISGSIIRRFGLSGDSADAVQQLFEVPATASNGVSVFSALLLLFSSVSFVRRLQAMYRSAWGFDPLGVRTRLFAALGLLALLVEVLVLYGIQSLARRLSAGEVFAVPSSALAGLLLWTSVPYLLLDRRVHWRRLLVTGALSALGTAVYGVVTAIYMPATVERYTNDFGLFGMTIVLIGWLLIVSGIVVGAAAIGAEFDTCLAGWAVRLKIWGHLIDPRGPRPVVSEEAEAAGLDRGDLVMFTWVLVSWSVSAAAVWVSTALVPGIEVPGGLATYLGISLLLGIVNAVLGPLLRLAALPFSILTLGLIALAVNGFFLEVVAALSPNLDVAGFGAAILCALVIAVVTAVLDIVLRPLRRLGTWSSVADEAHERS